MTHMYEDMECCDLCGDEVCRKCKECSHECECKNAGVSGEIADAEMEKGGA